MQAPDPTKAFNEAFDTYADELFRHALYRLSDRDKALDAVQEAYLRAWDYARKGTAIANIRALLYRTLRNIIIDEYRRKKPVSLDRIVDDEANAGAILAGDDDALGEAMDRLDAQRALALVPALPDPYAEVLLLRFVDGLSIAEIAGRIDTSENLVSVRIHRALRALHDLFFAGATPPTP